MRPRIVILFALLVSAAGAHGIEPLIVAGGQGLALLIGIGIACMPRLRGAGRVLAVVSPVLVIVLLNAFPRIAWWLEELFGYSDSVAPLLIIGVLPPLIPAVLSYVTLRQKPTEKMPNK